MGFLFDRPARVLLLVLATVLVFCVGAGRLRVDNSPAVWLPTQDPELDLYRNFRERFGEDTFLLAASGRREQAPSVFERMGAVAERVETLAGIDRVESPAIPGPDPVAGAGSTSGLLVGRERLALLVLPRGDLTDSQRKALVDELRATLAGEFGDLGPWELAGTDVVTRDLDRGSQTSMATLFPLVLAVMIGVLWFALRDVRMVGAIALSAAAASLVALGGLGFSGRSLNLLLAVVPATLVVVATAYSLHLLTRFQQLAPSEERLRLAGEKTSAGRVERGALWSEAIGHTFRPSLLTALTTAAGFGSLGLSNIPPVRDLGTFTALGVLASFVLTFTLVPACLVRSSKVLPAKRAAGWWSPGRSLRYVAALRRWRWIVVGAGLALAGLAGLGTAQLQVESHVLRFFPRDHALPVSYRSIEQDLFGLTTLDLWLEGDREDVLSAQTMQALDAFLSEASGEELARGGPLLPFPTEIAGLAPAARAAALRASLPRDSGALAPAARSYVWVEGDRLALRATLTHRTTSSNAANALVERLRSKLAQASVPQAVMARISGSTPLLVRGQVLLLETQMRSFGLALLVVTGVLLFAFRSFWLVVVSLLPNVLPIAVTLGVMGFAGIPLDSATVTVAGIALGLVVDDTIHLLHAYSTASRDRSRSAAVSEALAQVGRPVMTTSLALALGFGAFVATSFRPTHDFGLLIALTGLAALVCDLILLPAVLLFVREGQPLKTEPVV